MVTFSEEQTDFTVCSRGRIERCWKEALKEAEAEAEALKEASDSRSAKYVLWGNFVLILWKKAFIVVNRMSFKFIQQKVRATTKSSLESQCDWFGKRLLFLKKRLKKIQAEHEQPAVEQDSSPLELLTCPNEGCAKLYPLVN